MRRILPVLPKLTNVALGALLVTLALGPLASAQAQTTAEKGYEIAARADRTDRGFGDTFVELEMVLRDKSGKEARRSLSIQTLEAANEDVGDKSLITFETPRDIEGTGLLSHAKILEADDQWLYLPALKRVKRISSKNKSGPFVGSQFAFEDFTALELNKFTYEYLREEEHDGMMCDVVERKPRYEHSGYTKQISWIDQQDFQVRKVEFYDRRGDLLKTLTLLEYKKYGDYWRSHLLRMENAVNGKSTDLVYGEYEFDLGLTDDDFVKGALQDLR